ncbi:protein CLEC16A-like [Arapaima gigas]
METHIVLEVIFVFSPLQLSASVRRFTKPAESLERSLEISRQRGRKRAQKRPNYKNVGEEDEGDRESEDGADSPDRAKGTEGSSKGAKTSGDTEVVKSSTGRFHHLCVLWHQPSSCKVTDCSLKVNISGRHKEV